MQLFSEIKELYISSGVHKKSLHQDFDILLFNEFDANVKRMMPPHRRGFYTIIFMKDQKKGQISINQQKHTSLNNALLFQGMEHVFSFVRDEKVEGGVILFHKSFLLPFSEDVELSFPFFSISNQNLFHLSTLELSSFEQLFKILNHEKVNASVAKAILLAFLEKSKQLYTSYANEEQFLSKKSLLVRKYKNLITNHFIEQKGVSFYAEQLNVSANYLNEVIKSETGISAKRHITERVLLEAKNMLLYSEMDITEISHILNFSEPTHFTKFFKKETGFTPKSFQKQ